jgi:sugar lactone lactonase YvrE
MSEQMTDVIQDISPRAGVEGGEIIIRCKGYDLSAYGQCRVFAGERRGRIVSASSERVIAALPELEKGIGASEIRLESGSSNDSAPFIMGAMIADNLHPVTNPAIDHETGAIYVTLSGTRGQKVPVSIYKISPDNTVSPFNSDVVNPTGMMFDREGALYVTARNDGILYRFSQFNEPKTIAEDLGVATGIAINRRGEIFVGDRSGTIHRINEIGEARPFATLEPSVSAYHLAFGPDGDLYVTGPTVSSYDSVMRVDAMGNISQFYTGLGRPQGLAFDAEGNLYVAASLRGHRGIVRISSDGAKAEIAVAGATLVGLAFDESGAMIVVSTQRVYRVPLGIKGYSIFHSGF